jgi:hypothetical protein
MQTYTITRRFDNTFIEAGLTYIAALKRCEDYPNVDHVIHPDGTDWMAEKARQTYHDQGAWAWL